MKRPFVGDSPFCDRCGGILPQIDRWMRSGNNRPGFVGVHRACCCDQAPANVWRLTSCCHNSGGVDPIVRLYTAADLSSFGDDTFIVWNGLCWELDWVSNDNYPLTAIDPANVAAASGCSDAACGFCCQPVLIDNDSNGCCFPEQIEVTSSGHAWDTGHSGTVRCCNDTGWLTKADDFFNATRTLTHNGGNPGRWEWTQASECDNDTDEWWFDGEFLEMNMRLSIPGGSGPDTCDTVGGCNSISNCQNRLFKAGDDGTGCYVGDTCNSPLSSPHDSGCETFNDFPYEGCSGSSPDLCPLYRHNISSVQYTISWDDTICNWGCSDNGHCICANCDDVQPKEVDCGTCSGWDDDASCSPI